MDCFINIDEKGNMLFKSNGYEIESNNLKWGNSDSGLISPGGLLMGAIGGCKLSTFSKAAKFLKIPYSNLSIVVEAEIELLDKIGDTPFSDEKYKFIKIHYSLNTDADIEDIKKVIELSTRFCTIDIAIDPSIERIIDITILK